MVPDFLHEAPPMDACAAFTKASRMKFVNAKELSRGKNVEIYGIPHLAKNERAVGHPGLAEGMEFWVRWKVYKSLNVCCWCSGTADPSTARRDRSASLGMTKRGGL
jgi:hypothetical protein